MKFKKWRALEKEICCRCGEIAEYEFSENNLLVSKKRTYCKKHLLERIKEEKML